MRHLLLALLLASPASAQVAVQTFPPGAAAGGGTGGTITAPLLAPDGCATPYYSFVNFPSAGLCRGLAATWFADSTVLTTSDYADGIATFLQMGETEDWLLMGTTEADGDGATLYLQRPIAGTLWSNFVLFTLEQTTGTGASTTFNCNSTQATGRGDCRIEVNSDPSPTQTFIDLNQTTSGVNTWEQNNATVSNRILQNILGVTEVRAQVSSPTFTRGQTSWTTTTPGTGAVQDRVDVTGTGNATSTIYVGPIGINARIEASNASAGFTRVMADFGKGIEFVTTSATGLRPTCDINNHGYLWHEEGSVGGGGEEDVITWCMKDTDNAYNWELWLAPPAYGEMTMTTPAATTPSGPTKSLGTTTLGSARYFTMPVNNRLTYVADTTRDFHCEAYVSMTTGGNNVTATIYLAEGGTEDTNTEINRFVSTGADIGAASTGGIYELAQNEYIELFVDVTSSTITIQDMSMVCTGVD